MHDVVTKQLKDRKQLELSVYGEKYFACLWRLKIKWRNWDRTWKKTESGRMRLCQKQKVTAFFGQWQSGFSTISTWVGVRRTENCGTVNQMIIIGRNYCRKSVYIIGNWRDEIVRMLKCIPPFQLILSRLLTLVSWLSIFGPLSLHLLYLSRKHLSWFDDYMLKKKSMKMNTMQCNASCRWRI